MNEAWLDRIRLELGPVALVLLLLLFAHRATAVEVLEEIIEQRYALDPAGTLSISNTDGSIQIYGGDSPVISIQAIKKAYTQDRLKSIVVDVRATARSVAIETIFPRKKSTLGLGDRSGTVEYIITIPQTTRITKLDLVNGEILVEGLRGGSATAHLVNGWLVAHNCFGDLDLAIVNGRLEVFYDWWDERKFFVNLSSSQGHVRTVIPSDAPISMSARTTTGRIANALDMKKESPAEPVRALDFRIVPDPEVTFHMNSTNGNIQIEKMY